MMGNRIAVKTQMRFTVFGSVGIGGLFANNLCRLGERVSRQKFLGTIARMDNAMFTDDLEFYHIQVRHDLAEKW
jgi:hypothetical protein